MGVTTNLKLPYPELTDAVDGPSSFDALAQGVEDYFYRRILPAGITRMPVYSWGSASSFPSGAAAGDTFIHASLGPSLMRWNGAAWRQVEPAEVASATVRNAISLGPAAGALHPNFRVRQTDTGDLWRWDGAAWIWVSRDGGQAPTAIWNVGSAGFSNGGINAPVGTVVTDDPTICTSDPTNRQFVIASRGLYQVTASIFSDAGDNTGGSSQISVVMGGRSWSDQRSRATGYTGAGQLVQQVQPPDTWLEQGALVAVNVNKVDAANASLSYAGTLRIQRVAG